MKKQGNSRQIDPLVSLKSEPKWGGALPYSGKVRMIVTCIALLSILLAFVGHKQHQYIFANVSEPLPKTPSFSLTYLTGLPDAKLEQLDIAVLNLLCAQGLTGASEIDWAPLN